MGPLGTEVVSRPGTAERTRWRSSPQTREPRERASRVGVRRASARGGLRPSRREARARRRGGARLPVGASAEQHDRGWIGPPARVVALPSVRRTGRSREPGRAGYSRNAPDGDGVQTVGSASHAAMTAVEHCFLHADKPPPDSPPHWEAMHASIAAEHVFLLHAGAAWSDVIITPPVSSSPDARTNRDFLMNHPILPPSPDLRVAPGPRRPSSWPVRSSIGPRGAVGPWVPSGAAPARRQRRSADLEDGRSL